MIASYFALGWLCWWLAVGSYLLGRPRRARPGPGPEPEPERPPLRPAGEFPAGLLRVHYERHPRR